MGVACSSSLIENDLGFSGFLCEIIEIRSFEHSFPRTRCRVQMSLGLF